MSENRSSGEIAIGVVPHLLSFIACELCKYGFMLAYERGLSDLKGLIEPDSISEADIDLLETVDDEVIKILVQSIDRTLSCMKTYMIINNLDEFEVMEDDEYNQAASDIYHIYIIEWENKDYEQTLVNLNAMYFSVQLLIYHATQLLSKDDLEKDFFIEYEKFFDILNSIFNADEPDPNKNVALLNDLIIELNDDLLLIDKI
jgi:hypothetical protein